MPRNPDVPCASCGRLMWRSSAGSAVPGKSRCHPCRRIARGLRPDQPVVATLAAGRLSIADRRGDCHRCGGVVPGDGKRWKFCSDECFRTDRYARGSGSRPATSVRGYGAAHQRLRAELLPLAYGTACHFCSELMHDGDELHLDHAEDRAGYRGITHATCNIQDGAKRGGEAGRRARLEKGWRHGSSPGPRGRSQDTAA